MDELRTPEEWGEIFGCLVLDPDGWRTDGTPWDKPLTREDYQRRMFVSTILPRYASAGWHNLSN